MKFLTLIVIMISSSIGWSHARLLSPAPRNNNAGIKTGPCGGLARTATPTVVQGGALLTVQWEETVNHPGRYIFSLSQANDTGFAQNILATVIDVQNAGVPLPHRYQTQIMLPNIDCPTCTLQMIQSMEENPAAPTYYYSCADINISTTVIPPPPPPTPGPSETVQSSTLNPQLTEVKFGQGCGTVKATGTPNVNYKWILTCLLMMLIPTRTWARLRAVSISKK